MFWALAKRLAYVAGLLALSYSVFFSLAWESLPLAALAAGAMLLGGRRLRETPKGNELLGLSRRQRHTGRAPRPLEDPRDWLRGELHSDARRRRDEPHLVVDDDGRRRVVWPDRRVVTLDAPPPRLDAVRGEPRMSPRQNPRRMPAAETAVTR